MTVGARPGPDLGSNRSAGPIEGGYQVSELRESEEAHRAWFEAYVIPSLPAGAPRPTVAMRPITGVVTND
jgi:hypothetical protein